MKIKKIIPIVLISILPFLFVGCSSNHPVVTTPKIVYQIPSKESSEVEKIEPIENTEFVFVKKNGVYYLKKRSELNKRR